MTNPFIISILGYLREQNSSCSLVDLVALCQQDFLSLILRDVDPQIVIFQKNFFVMNALYQIQRDIQTEGFSLTIFPLEICMMPNRSGAKDTLTTRDTDLARYYLDWSNLNNITVEEVETLFSSFWQRYSAVDKIDAALATLGIEQEVDWFDIRQAYQKRIVISHPDKGGCADDFIETRAAYEILRFSYHRT
ncbi:DNA-J related domain-containing protein [Colwellia sp. TT2012]|uniref:DNA-J related domain-containing protein n=1 Tax=Colwellia sp. TT2012 TaxID=1720342 RepID=UPI00070CF38D|nr:DNA-J related domain-containing protein [Colwellia sp. TT2012]